MNRTTKRIAAIGMPLAVVAATGVAFAAWTQTGAGSGYGNGKLISVNVSTAATDAPTADLEPGGSGALIVKLGSTNLSRTAVLTGVTEPTPPSPNTCSVSLNTTAVAAWFTAHDESTHAGDTTLDVPSAGGTYTIPNGISLGTDSDNSCQNSAIALPVTVALSTK